MVQFVVVSWGAARIAPPAIINPARTHPEFIIAAVAARDQAKAEAFARKHGIEKVYSGATGYQGAFSLRYNPRLTQKMIVYVCRHARRQGYRCHI